MGNCFILSIEALFKSFNCRYFLDVYYYSKYFIRLFLLDISWLLAGIDDY